jgi:hypothetical protein
VYIGTTGEDSCLHYTFVYVCPRTCFARRYDLLSSRNRQFVLLAWPISVTLRRINSGEELPYRQKPLSPKHTTSAVMVDPEFLRGGEFCAPTRKPLLRSPETSNLMFYTKFAHPRQAEFCGCVRFYFVTTDVPARGSLCRLLVWSVRPEILRLSSNDTGFSAPCLLSYPGRQPRRCAGA